MLIFILLKNYILVRVIQFREYTLARMFENCTISYPPKINEGYKPYGKGSFAAMFKNCTSLIDIPFNEITLANSYAYNDMFYHCTSLNKVPVISATSIFEGSFERRYVSGLYIITYST